MILFLSINSTTTFHQQDSSGPYQYNPHHSPDHILQVILEAGKEQGDRMINKLEIHAPCKPFHYAWLSPTRYSVFLAQTRSCVSQANSTVLLTFGITRAYPKPEVDRTVATERLRLQFADQESEATLVQVMNEQMRQPHLSRSLRFNRLIIDLNFQILDPYLVFKHLKVKGPRKVQHRSLP